MYEEKKGNMVMTPQEKYDALIQNMANVKTLVRLLKKDRYMTVEDILAVLDQRCDFEVIPQEVE